ncbi:class A beta-lactamase [Prauserella marina]|uniref:Beta-lactamase n=1 Tax=Prauserella marina TaxID=530584 RepID=A0A222VNQ1_9PSEU|nr:class A beta-lactamase [Prauserella marina]ASR35538.1 class A beta-lactamase [Prauserella marina]PWV84622.1 beta-lactamase class A [Prauserella marina]SDC17451.1 beta-lactamase class A [Prauserella marina]
MPSSSSVSGSRGSITRRAVLGAAVALPLAACSAGTDTAAGRAPAPVSSPESSEKPTRPQRHDRLHELERDYGARLGVYALATGSGAVVEHRADERFAFCSTFKGLAAAAVLQRNPSSHVDTVLTFTEADLLSSSFVTREHVASGMTIGQLCDAAVRYSDGTAGNLLVRDLGGPGEFTAFLREIGDEVTRMDRPEPELTEAKPGDPRDTTSPRAIGTDYQGIVLGDVLPEDKRGFLRDLLERNTTGDERIRAGVPEGWTVADKTGTGSYGTMNDIGIGWPPSGEPLVIAIMSSKADPDSDYDQKLIADATEYVVTALT